MFALFPSLFVILATMSSVESSPLVTVPTFPSGAGNLAVLSAGQQVGCLTPQWKMAIDATLCGTFDAKALPGAQTYYNINSIEGACGFRYQYNRTILAENAQYIIGCGSSAGDINPELEFYPGRYSHINWAVLVVRINRNFTTIDGRSPTGSETLTVATDPWMSTPSDYQIGWKPLLL